MEFRVLSLDWFMGFVVPVNPLLGNDVGYGSAVWAWLWALCLLYGELAHLGTWDIVCGHYGYSLMGTQDMALKALGIQLFLSTCFETFFMGFLGDSYMVAFM